MPSPMPTIAATAGKPKANAFWRWTCNALFALAALGVLAVLIWQGITSAGNPIADAATISPNAAAVNAGIIVFREGLEAILVLAALTASLTRDNKGHWKPVSLGAGLSFLATVATWFVVVGIISDVNAPELAIQAGTGLLAVVVLLVIMNWFFHKLYWTGWITHHNRRKRDLTDATGQSTATIYRGLLIVGFTSVYREGFEVVLFLQHLRLEVGSAAVMAGVSIGLLLTAVVGVLTFVAHAKLPYRKMLIATGILLGGVLVVMVGESVEEMQQAHWLTTTALDFSMPGWLHMWFAIYPTLESLGAQVLSIVYVVGTYALARHLVKRRRPAATRPPQLSRDA